MKTGYKIAIGVFGTLAAISIIQRFNNKPKIWYVDKLGVAGITIPPFGIIIKKEIPKNEEIRKQDPNYFMKATLIHEMVHWKQFQKQGYLLFYLGYLSSFIKNGFSYLNNSYEQEAYLKQGRTVDVVKDKDGNSIVKKIINEKVKPKNLAPKFYDDENNNVYYWQIKNGVAKKIIVANIDKKFVSTNLPDGTKTPLLKTFYENKV